MAEKLYGPNNYTGLHSIMPNGPNMWRSYPGALRLCLWNKIWMLI
ncbi:uncharacterized protein G2W53_043246 [Senna tora]|uniref:Uncharacterized protein n=1 Tax=Senna tora TaxID=362788 RepID=A0A834SKL0_9FABA|nr:uncharacterized protein G2W53_043246 [Senna tora]